MADETMEIDGKVPVDHDSQEDSYSAPCKLPPCYHDERFSDLNCLLFVKRLP